MRGHTGPTISRLSTAVPHTHCLSVNASAPINSSISLCPGAHSLTSSSALVTAANLELAAAHVDVMGRPNLARLLAASLQLRCVVANSSACCTDLKRLQLQCVEGSVVDS
jgi:hypothetical protein